MKLVEMIDRINNLKASKNNNDDFFNQIKEWEKNCFDCLNDDFNTPMLIAEIFNSSKLIHQFEKTGAIGLREKDYFLTVLETLLNDILGINYNKSKSDNDSILEILLSIRDNAREKKDFDLSDSIRDQLNKLGIKLNDKN